MSSKKVLVVFGATGNQGGSVIAAILSDPRTKNEFDIRAVTRDPSKSTAVDLAQRGVTVVQADLNDKASLRTALAGSYAVFAMTNFRDTMSREGESLQGKNIAEIAKELEVQHLIWSSLPNASKISNNKFTGVLHFDSKADVEDYIRSLGIPYTVLILAAFMPFVVGSIRCSDSGYKLSLPVPSSTKIPLISVSVDSGAYVKAILLNREKFLGQQVCAGEREYTFSEIISILKEVGGLEVVFEQCSGDDFKNGLANLGAPEVYQEDMLQNMQYIAEFGFYGKAEFESDHKFLDKPLMTFDEYVAQNSVIAAMKLRHG